MIDPVTLETAQRESLDLLLHALDLRPDGHDRFVVDGEPSQFPHIFGGQLVAQALAAAGATVSGKTPSSLHACFAAAGTPTQPLDLTVDRVRDGRSMATREVRIEQGDRTLLSMLATFSTSVLDEIGVENRPLFRRERETSSPTELPPLQDWVPKAPEAFRDQARSWIERPPAVEIRIGEPPVFLGGVQGSGPRTHWLRLPHAVGDDPLLHATLLAYASDFLLLDMAFRSHPVPFTSGRVMGTSLDHSIWFHRPVRFDRWHRYTQETVALVGERGLIRGSIHDDDGALIASTAEEVLVRVTDPQEQR